MMVEYFQYIVIVGAVVQFLGSAHYIKAILLGKAKPNKVTWLLWAIAPLIGAVAAFSDGVRLAILPTFMSGFGPLLVFIFSFVNKNAYWQLNKLDYVCGVFSLLALILWVVTKQAWVAIILAIASDGLASIPTLIKSFKYPETENASPFIAGLFSQLTIFPVIKVWNFSSLSFPLYLILMNLLLTILIHRPQKPASS